MAISLDVDLESGLSTDKIPAAAVVHEKRGAGSVALARSKPESKRRWITPHLISKAEHVSSDFRISTSGFPSGTFSDKGFCEFIRMAPSHVQNSVVCDVIWWRSNRPPLHHQFLVLTVAHQKGFESECSVAMYDLRIERVGKGLSFRGTAEQKITITPAQPVKRYQEDNNTILFGLTDALPHLRRGNESHLSGQYTGVETFVDELDIKWRGPPATLWHIARYVDVIVKSAPRYSLASTNCYYFARVLFHIIGLRHYSFHRLISERADTLGTRSRVHDPSSISMLFRFLLEEEKSNGVLLHKYVQGWIAIFLAVMILGIILFGAVELGLHHPGLFYSLLGVGALWGLCLWALLVFMQNSALVARYQGEMRRKTERLVSVLDDDLELTNPRGKRGDYHLPFYLKRITETESLTTPFGREVEIVKWVERDGPREPVSQWPNPEQCYKPQE